MFDEHAIDFDWSSYGPGTTERKVNLVPQLCDQAFVAVMEHVHFGSSDDWAVVGVRR